MKFKQWFVLHEQRLYDYSSTQINLPSKEAKEILNWSKNNISDRALYVQDGRYGREDEIHVTILYGLHTTKPEGVKKISSGFGPFDIKLGKISRFDNEKYDVIKIEVESAKLRELHGKLKSLNHTDSYNSYKPHCTLAYVKKGSCKNLDGKNPFMGKTIKVNSIIFSSKSGNKEIIKLA